MKVVGIYKRHNKRTLVARMGEELGIECFGQTYGVLPKTPGLIYNFGNSDQYPLPDNYRWINHPNVIKNAALKNVTLKLLTAAGVPTLEWTEDYNVALKWPDLVYCRELISVSQGRGITLWARADEAHHGDIPEAKLYTKGYPKTHEFRIHTHAALGAFDTVIKMPVTKTPDMEIRSHNKGWDLVHLPPDVALAYDRQGGIRHIEEIAQKAVKACDMDMGAVDVLAQFEGYTFKDAVVCEVNSGPAIRKKVSRPQYVKLFRGEFGEL